MCDKVYFRRNPFLRMTAILLIAIAEVFHSERWRYTLISDCVSRFRFLSTIISLNWGLNTPEGNAQGKHKRTHASYVGGFADAQKWSHIKEDNKIKLYCNNTLNTIEWKYINLFSVFMKYPFITKILPILKWFISFLEKPEQDETESDTQSKTKPLRLRFLLHIRTSHTLSVPKCPAPLYYTMRQHNFLAILLLFILFMFITLYFSFNIILFIFWLAQTENRYLNNISLCFSCFRVLCTQHNFQLERLLLFTRYTCPLKSLKFN